MRSLLPCVLLFLPSVAACADPPSAAEPEVVTDETAVPSEDPGPRAPLPARPPDGDPWAAAGLEDLRNGGHLGWPVESVHITSGFGWRVDPVTGSGVRLHRGLDFRGAVGDLVLGIGPGTVAFSGTDPALGQMVIVDHGLGVRSLYGHLSDLLVTEGTVVQRGAALGLVGNTGRSAAPHLHLTVKVDDVAVDPLFVLGQPLHRATALRGAPPAVREPVVTQAAGDAGAQTPAAPPVLQP